MATSPVAHFSLPLPLLSLLLLLFATFPGLSRASSLKTDTAALLSFKSRIIFDPYLITATWTTEKEACDWPGVICTDRRITALDFSGAGLEGLLPTEIGNLDHLETFFLTGNSLKGPIPESIGKLKALKILDFSGNPFTGSIPESLCNCTNLESLTVSQTFLSGFIPLNMGRLKKLCYLDLSNNILIGSIPESLWNLTNLEHFDLSKNTLTGVLSPGVENLIKVSFFSVSGNQLSGSIPGELGKLTLLSELSLNENVFSGRIPPSLFSNCTSLTGIFLNNNLLLGPIPSTFQNCVNLEDFEAYDNQLSGNLSSQVDWSVFSFLRSIFLSINSFSGPIPSSFGECYLLGVLDLSNNNLTGPIPDSFENLKSLFDISLEYNPLNTTLNPKLFECKELSDLKFENASLYGPIPVSLQNLQKLSLLRLSNNSLSGELPPELTNCCKDGMNVNIRLQNNLLTGPIPAVYFTEFSNVVELHLSHNRLSENLPREFNGNLVTLNLNDNLLFGPLPTSLFDIESLQELHIQNNFFNGTLPLNFFSSNLTDIDISNNDISGQIPSLGPDISGLQTLNLSNNKLTNGIPPEIFLLDSLEILDLRSNDLSGPLSIPAEASINSSLRLLFLSENQISGSLPTTLNALSGLVQLQLDKNNLSGEIPLEIRNLSRLQILSLSNNNLTGEIPEEIGTLPVISDLNLGNNRLSSSIPANLSRLSSLKILDLSNNRLTGKIPSNLGNLSVLSELNFSNNKLTGSIPIDISGLSGLLDVDFSYNYLSGRIPRGNLSLFNASSFSNNSNLCGEPLDPCPAELLLGLSMGILLGSFCIFSCVLLIGLYGIYLYRRSGPDGGELKLYHKLPVSLTYRGILKATDYWSESRLLGSGGFGSVYKALLSDSLTLVAIKRLSQESSQGNRELQAEIETLGKIKHRNIVQLLGSFISKKEALLIYEYLPGGDLGSFLGGDQEVFRNWNIRLKMLLGSSKGLKYLHHDNRPAVIHRDIKPQNILLDSNLEAHIADFGLAREIQYEKDTPLSTIVCGTVGYMALEYFNSRNLSVRTDVFAFGVVILEVVTGKRPTDRNLGEESLSSWVSKLWTKGKALETIDPKLNLREEEVGEILGTLKVGLMCTSTKPESRPTMAEVVLLLERIDIFRNLVSSHY